MTPRQALTVMLSGFAAKVENVDRSTFHVTTTPGQLERVRDLINAELPGVEYVLAYNDHTLGVFLAH